MERRFVFIISIIVILIAILAIICFYKNPFEKPIEPEKSKIILKIPIIKNEIPSNPLSRVITTGYEDKIITEGEEFVLDDKNLADQFGNSVESQVGMVSLKLEEVKAHSLIIEVLGYESFDGKIHPRNELLSLHTHLEDVLSLKLDKEIQDKILSTRPGWGDVDYFFKARDRQELENQLKEITSLTKEEKDKIIILWDDVFKKDIRGVKNGDCMPALGSTLMDVIFYYCFEIKKNENNLLELYYNIKSESTMPLP